jgi:undecaprenyl diphosphate synthase
MDGNRRFGKIKHGDPLKGHWEGGQVLLDFVQWCQQDGVQIVTVYAFSTENWSRDASEVDLLMTMFGKYANTMAEEAEKRNVKVKILSTDYHRLPLRVQKSIEELERATKDCRGLVLNICLSYGTRADITQACSKVVEAIIARGDSNGKGEGFVGVKHVDVEAVGMTEGVEESKGEQKEAPVEKLGTKTLPNQANTAPSLPVVTEAMLSENLSTAGLPDPDMLIRTSGEVRISNFLLWQLAYTEMFFVPKFWPEITQEDYHGIMRQFADRKRRFGS